MRESDKCFKSIDLLSFYMCQCLLKSNHIVCCSDSKTRVKHTKMSCVDQDLVFSRSASLIRVFIISLFIWWTSGCLSIHFYEKWKITWTASPVLSVNTWLQPGPFVPGYFGLGWTGGPLSAWMIDWKHGFWAHVPSLGGSCFTGRRNIRGDRRPPSPGPWPPSSCHNSSSMRPPVSIPLPEPISNLFAFKKNPTYNSSLKNLQTRI